MKQATLNTEFASRVKERRAALNISARELDRRAGLAEGHTSLIETGTRGAEAKTLAALAVALGVTLDWLVLGRDVTPPNETTTS
jgi:transcriptional regulator with XRE-family HTH domain